MRYTCDSLNTRWTASFKLRALVAIGAKRLLDDDPRRVSRSSIGQARRAKLRDGRLVELRRGGQIVDARCVMALLQHFQSLGECNEILAAAQCRRVGRRSIGQTFASFRQSNSSPANSAVVSASFSRHSSSLNAVREKPTIRVPSGSRFLRYSP